MELATYTKAAFWISMPMFLLLLLVVVVVGAKMAGLEPY
jgi:hypothetical protein